MSRNLADAAVVRSSIRSIGSALRPRIGERLRAVEYGDYCDEESRDSYPLDDPDLDLAGGVVLRFEGVDLMLSAAGVNDWVVQASNDSSFANYLESFDAGGLSYWHSFVDQPLLSAAVLGLELEPIAIRLDFPQGSVLVWVAGGEGSIYVSRPDTKSYLANLETLWTSADPDVIHGAASPATAPRTDYEVPLGYSEVPVAVLLVAFVVSMVVLWIAPTLHPWLGLPIAAGFFALSFAGYRSGEERFIGHLRVFLAFSSIAAAAVTVRAHWLL